MCDKLGGPVKLLGGSLILQNAMPPLPLMSQPCIVDM